MEFRLVNENFEKDYVKQIIAGLGGDADVLREPTEAQLGSPLDLENIQAGAHLLKGVLQRDGHIVIIVD